MKPIVQVNSSLICLDGVKYSSERRTVDNMGRDISKEDVADVKEEFLMLAPSKEVRHDYPMVASWKEALTDLESDEGLG